MAMTDEKLKPCPFCGAHEVSVHECFDDYWVECDICGQLAYDTEPEAIAAWNRRE